MPPPKSTISEFGDQHYVLPPEHGGGKWKTKSFQKGIADAMCDPEEERTTVMKGMRVGYTKIVNLAIMYYVAADPSSILVVQPTLDDAEGYNEDELQPLIDQVDIVRKCIKPADNKILKKRYPGGTLTLVGANTPTGFRRLTVRVVISDETSAYPLSTGADGDPLRQAIGRSFSAHNRKIICGSTPTISGVCRIEKEFSRSDQRFYHIKCPHCDHWHVLKFSNMKWTEGHPEDAHFVCPKCENKIEEYQKQELVDNGQWRSLKKFECCGEKQKPCQWDKKGRPICKHCNETHISGHAGFHIWAAYSDLPNAKWSKLAEYWEEVKEVEEEKIVFINTILGEAYKEEETAVVWKELYNRRENYGLDHDEKIPEGVRIILASVDTQDNRLELTVAGFGVGEECWLLDRKMFPGQPDDQEVQKKLTRALDETYTHADGFLMPITACAIDIQGHFYDTMLEYCAEHQWRCIPIRGGSDFSAPAIKPPTKSNVYKIPLYTLGVNNIKNTLSRRLKYQYPGRKYIHFPISNDFERDYFEQMTAETVVTKYKNGIPYRVFENTKKARNEAWDMLVYLLAVLWIWNPDLDEYYKLEDDIEDDDDFFDDDDDYEDNWMSR